MAYSYDQLEDALTAAKKEALIADLTCIGWEYDDPHFKVRGQSGGNPYAGGATRMWEVTVAIDGSIIDQGACSDDDIGRYTSTVEEFAAKWEANLDSVAVGWQEYQIPKPSDFDDAIAAAAEMVKDLSDNTGSKNAAIGNPNLEALGNMRDLFPNAAAAKGETLSRFYQCYGPNRLATVLDGHCEAAACLFLALQAGQEVWTKAREDIGANFSAVVDYFKQTRQNNETTWEPFFTAATAVSGLVAAWATGPVGALAGGLAATTGFLGTAVAELEGEPEEPQGKYAGSSPDDVYTDLQSALNDLSDSIAAREEAIGRMLTSFRTQVHDRANRDNFHVNSDKGLDRTYQGSDDIIDVKFPVLRDVGYTMMPKIASALYDASDAGAKANTSYPWSRLFVGRAPHGAFPEWQELYYAVYPLMDDSGAEIVKAGQHLGEAAGYFEAADDSAAEAMGKHQKEVEGSTLGWVKPHVDPPPPPPEARHGGLQPETY